MECLDEETVLAFAAGDLPEARRTEAHEHIASCDECRALVSAVARSSFVEKRPADATRPDPAVSATELADSGNRGDGTAPVRRGDVLAGKYVVDTVLGTGGMGVVVSAHQKDLDRRVAVKFLLPAACEVQGAVERFLREGKAAARITSEHVARVIDTGKLESGAPYLVMEHLVGADLAAVTKDRGRVSWQDAVEYVLQACEAIVEAHALGIVHRDLKPANLFLTKRADGTPFVKVLDFGISKIDGGSRRDLTTASMLMGSPRYMSPEQMLSAKDVDARTDVWALGVILYELVAGKPVWEADTVHGLSALIATAPAPALRATVADVPAALEDVVARCLTKAREARIASVADLALGLEPIAPARARPSVDRILKVAGRERMSLITAPASAAATLSLPPTSKPRGAVLVIAALVGALLVLGVVLNVMASRQTPEASLPSSPAASPTTAAATSTTGTMTATTTGATPAIEAAADSAALPAASGSASAPASAHAAPKPAAVVKKSVAAAASAGASVAAAPPATPAAREVAPKAVPSASNRALVDRK